MLIMQSSNSPICLPWSSIFYKTTSCREQTVCTQISIAGNHIVRMMNWYTYSYIILHTPEFTKCRSNSRRCVNSVQIYYFKPVFPTYIALILGHPYTIHNFKIRPHHCLCSSNCYWHHTLPTLLKFSGNVPHC